jgi:hypothetical protein
MYTFVNRNYLIPFVSKYISLTEALNKLQDETILRAEIKYNQNVYVVEETVNDTILYYSDGNTIFAKNLTSNNDPIVYHKYNTVSLIGSNFIIPYKNKQIDNNLNTNKDMNITFGSIDKNNIIINEKESKNVSFNLQPNTYISEKTKEIIANNTNLKDNEENTEKNKKSDEEKKQDIIKMIEEVNDLYQKELSNMKRLEMNIKTIDLKISKLEKKKRDDIINDIIRTQSEYRTWKRIKYGIKEDKDELNVLKPIQELVESYDKVPILFQSKYDYLDKIQENESIKDLLNRINLIDLNKLYSDDNLPEKIIIRFCDKYMKLSKELHYTFDHEWDYLEHEMNLNSTNRLSVQK